MDRDMKIGCAIIVVLIAVIGWASIQMFRWGMSFIHITIG